MNKELETVYKKGIRHEAYVQKLLCSVDGTKQAMAYYKSDIVHYMY